MVIFTDLAVIREYICAYVHYAYIMFLYAVMQNSQQFRTPFFIVALSMCKAVSANYDDLRVRTSVFLFIVGAVLFIQMRISG